MTLVETLQARPTQVKGARIVRPLGDWPDMSDAEKKRMHTAARQRQWYQRHKKRAA